MGKLPACERGSEAQMKLFKLSGEKYALVMSESDLLRLIYADFRGDFPWIKKAMEDANESAEEKKRIS